MTKDEFNKYLSKNYDTLSSDLFRYIFSLTNNKEEAEDIIQETFLRAIEFIDSFNYGNMKAWLFSIAKKVFLYKQIMQKREQQLSIEESNNQIGKEDIEKEMFEDLQKEKLIKELEKLPEKYREVFLYCDLYGLSYEITAKILRLPIGTVKSRLHNARKILASKIFNVE